jgi:charged multivesicular body protein 1
MGAKHTLEDDLITFRLTSKQMARSAKKCESNAAAQKEKVKKAIKDGNMEGARIYGQNAIREKNQALNFLRLGSRIDAVASRLETAIRMQQINKAMTQTVKGMSNAMKSMKVEQIASTMEEFAKSFEDMDVRSGYMESTMESSTSMTTPPEEVDNLLQMVADEAGLQISGQLDSAGPVGSGVKKEAAPAQVNEADNLEKRLAELRK